MFIASVKYNNNIEFQSRGFDFWVWSMPWVWVVVEYLFKNMFINGMLLKTKIKLSIFKTDNVVLNIFTCYV